MPCPARHTYRTLPRSNLPTNTMISSSNRFESKINTHRRTGTTRRGFLIQNNSLLFHPNRRLMPLRLPSCLEHFLFTLPILGFLHPSALLSFLLVDSGELFSYHSVLAFPSLFAFFGGKQETETCKIIVRKTATANGIEFWTKYKQLLY